MSRRRRRSPGAADREARPGTPRRPPRRRSLEARSQLAKVAGVEAGVLLDPLFIASPAQRRLEPLGGYPVDDVAEHLHEAPVGIPGEAGVGGAPGKSLDRVIAEAEVEHRLQHPRHRVTRSRSHRDEQRVGAITEPLSGALLEGLEGGIHLRVEAGHLPRLGLHVGDAGAGRDREAGGNPVGAEDPGHLGDVGSLAAEHLSHLAGTLRELVDVAGLGFRLRQVATPRRDSKLARRVRQRPAGARGRGARASR